MGVSIEVLKSKSDKWIADGWSLDVFTGKKTAGLGIAKDLYKNDLFELDAGAYVVKDKADLLDFSKPVDFKIGFSGTWRF